MNRFTKTSAKKLHQKYASGRNKDKFFDLIWTHSEIVAAIASRIVQQLDKLYSIKVDSSLVEIGALLHDIGVYLCFVENLNPDKTLPKYICHGKTGYDLLRKEGYPENVARFALIHTGTGITNEDIQRDNLPLEEGNYIPITLEEEIVCYADKFHTKYPSFNNFDEQKNRLEKFDPSKGIIMDRFKQKFGVPDISDLEVKYKHWQEEFDNYFVSLYKQTES